MKVIILCGGMGTRLREETEYKPKPMVEIGGKPILWHIMKIYSFYGFNKFVLALGYKGSIIRDYFINYFHYNNDITVHLGEKEKIKVHNNHREKDWEVTLVDTGLESMTGYRVKAAGKYINEDNFMLTYGDAVSNVNLIELQNFHKSQGTIGTVTGVYPPSRFGDMQIDDQKVTAFKEKAKFISDEKTINGGFFIFKSEFLDLLPDDTNCDLERQPLESLVDSGELSVYRHKDFWQCMDTYRDYLFLSKLWDSDPAWKIWE
jgi:glucose-1-phosphate cytidylyltransferase